MTAAAGGDGGGADPLEVRPPLQRRSREAWNRVLDAGVALLEEGGYEAFTIAAVCARAEVAPRALYARVDTKDALFLAVYEHGMERVRADELVLEDDARWAGLPPEQVVAEAVHEIAATFRRHAALLRSVILISGAHEEVYRRGGAYVRGLGDRFVALVLRHTDAVDHADVPAAARAAFTMLFSTLVIRTAYGPGFVAPVGDDDAFLRELAEMVRRYLFPR